MKIYVLLLVTACSLALISRCSAQSVDTKQPAAGPLQKLDKAPVAKVSVVQLEHGLGDSIGELSAQDRELIDQVNASRVSLGVDPLRTVDTIGVLGIYQSLYGELKQQLAQTRAQLAETRAFAVGEHGRITRPVNLADLKERESAMTVPQLVENYNKLLDDHDDLGRDYNALLADDERTWKLLDLADKLLSVPPPAPVHFPSYRPAPPPPAPLNCVTQYSGSAAYTTCN